MSNRKPTAASTVSGPAWILAHLFGVVAVAVLTALPFVDRAGVSLLAEHYARTGQIPHFELAIHAAISTSIWLLIVAIYAAKKERKPRNVKLQAGTVMTETLIALPVCLMLIFGLGQMAVNNIAGILADLAAFQSGRAVWVWHPEWEAGRGDTDRGAVEEMARIQAATVLAPVAPGDYAIDAGQGDAPNFARALGVLHGRHVDAGGSDVGVIAYDEATANIRSAADGGSSGRFTRALDESTFKTRTARKFAAAFTASSVEILEQDGEVGVRLTYHHLNVFPVVGRIFGSRAEHGGRGGYYSDIVREFTLPNQVTPNARMPLR